MSQLFGIIMIITIYIFIYRYFSKPQELPPLSDEDKKRLDDVKCKYCNSKLIIFANDFNFDKGYYIRSDHPYCVKCNKYDETITIKEDDPVRQHLAHYSSDEAYEKCKDYYRCSPL